MIRLEVLKLWYNKTKQMFSNNRAAILAYNAWFLKNSISVGCFVSFVAILLGCFVSNIMQKALPGYILCFLLFLIELFIFKTKRNDKLSLIGLYAFFVIFFCLALYLSLIIMPDRPAGTMLIFLTLVPFCFIDNPIRLNLYVILLYLIHTVLSFVVKEISIAQHDAINCSISTLVGLCVGNVVLRQRLLSFDHERVIETEKITDILTNLPNRRKLFETLDEIKGDNKIQPISILMLDIDGFKQYNDKYGHVAGDICLHKVGGILNSYAKTDNTYFYRYGGEEFVALIYSNDKSCVEKIAESIRLEIFNFDMATDKESVHVTVSIGAVICNKQENPNYEYWIKCADIALYHAKNTGKNKVVFYE